MLTSLVVPGRFLRLPDEILALIKETRFYKHQTKPMEPNGFEESRLKAISLDHLGGEVHALEHRRNYETLKAAFEQLKHDYIRSEESWKLKSRQMHMKERKALTRLEEANSQIHALLTELNSRTQLENDPQWVESIRLEIHQKYEDEIDRAHSCILAARDENKKLNRKIATLQSQLEFAKTETQADWQQQQILYEAEIANLRHIKEDLLSRNQCLSSNELDRSKDECKQNAQLQTKCQLLTDEVESLKKQLDSQKAIFLGGNENLLKNMTNLKIKNCELEAERENLNKQLCVMRQEVEQLRSELHMEKQRVSDAKHASTEAEFKLSQLTQRTRGELANLRLEAQEQRTAIEKQRDQFASKAQELEHKLELVSARCQQVESDAAAHALASTEKEVIARDQWIREKTILEARCAELSNRLKATQITSSTDNVKNQFDHIGSSRTTANCKCKQTLDDQKEEIARLNEKLNHAELLNSQLNELLRQKTSEETRGEQSNEVGQLQLTLFEKLKERDELKSQLHTVRANLKRYMEDASKKKQRLSRHIRRLKELNQLEKLETEKLKTENEILRQNVPQEEYNRIRLLLNDLKRRHEEYQSIILGPAHPFLPQLCASRANLEYSAEWAKEKVVQDMELSSPSKSTAYNESTTQTSENDRGVLDHLHSP
ncbi:hypothetical protein FGIG_03620 [Fasciola gigantica]|uniref:Centrosomal protein of 83 kDa n=1 Tax=Fasciola gigantica TaxID=46835 RepID=A0A504YH34_FASGI|nr:hypothetical protein FGIG_03620 [Fasciola gigantica]